MLRKAAGYGALKKGTVPKWRIGNCTTTERCALKESIAMAVARVDCKGGDG